MSTEQLNEFTLSLPMNPVVASAAAADSAYCADPDNSSVVVGTPVGLGFDPKRVTVYASTITPTTYGTDENGVATFDVVFTVGIDCDGKSNTYQIVKRIGVDKAKIAAEVQSSQPVSVVESVQATAPKKKDPTEYVLTQTEAFKRLAGL